MTDSSKSLMESHARVIAEASQALASQKPREIIYFQLIRVLDWEICFCLSLTFPGACASDAGEIHSNLEDFSSLCSVLALEASRFVPCCQIRVSLFGCQLHLSSIKDNEIQSAFQVCSVRTRSRRSQSDTKRGKLTRILVEDKHLSRIDCHTRSFCPVNQNVCDDLERCWSQ